MKKNVAKSELARRAKQSQRDKAERARVAQLMPSKTKTNSNAKKLMRAAQNIGQNPYLARVLCPEYASIGGIPDEFSGLTHCAKIITQYDCPFDSNGLSSGFLTTSLQHLLHMSKTAAQHAAAPPMEYSAAGEGSKLVYSKAHLDPKNAATSALLWGLSIGAHAIPNYSAATLNEAVVPTTGNRYLPVNNPYVEADKAPVSMNWNKDDVGINRPSVHCAATDQVLVVVDTANAVAVNIVLGIVTSVSEGTTLVVTEAAATAGPRAAATITVPATHTRFYGVTFKAAVSTWYIAKVDVKLTHVAPTTGHDNHSTYPIGANDNSDYSAISSTAIDYRIVGNAAWIQYNGAMTSGGKLAIASIAKQENPQWSGANYDDFDTLAAIPGAYSGPLNKGGYAFWFPTSNADLEWRQMSDLATSDNFVAWSLVAHDTPAQNVTVRIATIVEFQTHLQYLGPKPSEVAVPQIWDAFARLAHEPHAMENSLHLRTILDILEKGTKWGSRVALAAAAPLSFVPGVGPALSGTALAGAGTMYALNKGLAEFRRDTRGLL